jgi:hypothetical protein
MTATAPARLRVVPDSEPAPERSVEVRALAQIQRRIGRPPVVRAARGLSHFGEHAIGWFAIGVVGAVVDRKRRREWLTGAAGVVTAHAASLAV